MQDIFSCKDLQELVLHLEPKISERPSFPAEVARIIDEFYDAKRAHDEDACTLLTRFYAYGDADYRRTVAKILANSEHYHAGALFSLAQIQMSQRARRRTGTPAKDAMDAEVFATVVKAFERIAAVSPKILESVEWVFAASVDASRKDPTRSPFYNRMVACVCQYAKSHPEIVLKVLQCMEAHAALMKHSTANDLGSALVGAYKDHFMFRFRDCGHAAYATVIGEMLRARLECKHYVRNGDVAFDAEVVEFIRRMHSTKKKLMKMLVSDFP